MSVTEKNASKEKLKQAKKRPVHAEIKGFPIVDGQLTIAGIKISEIAEKSDGRAFYAYDRSLMKARVAELREFLPKEIKIHYAMKANPMPELVTYMAGVVDGVDVASQGELKIALEAGAGIISFAGPGKMDAELKDAIITGVVINAESIGELKRIFKISDNLGVRAKVAVRVNPDFELKSSGMKMGGGASPFGIDAEQVPEALKEINNSNVEFIGFHIFSGSQNLREEALLDAAAKTFELAEKLEEYSDVPMRQLNIGGGLGIAYFPGDVSLDLKSFGQKLRPLVDSFKNKYPKVDVIMELGRYLVGEAGLYICSVIDQKISRGKKFLVTNGGLHHHLAASGNFGQILKKNYPMVIGNKMSADDLHPDNCENVNIVGCLCTPLDKLGEKIDLPKAEIGDSIVIFHSGAYGLSSSPVGFLGHPEPDVYFL
jgi:diaminopimelate decarboxylase